MDEGSIELRAGGMAGRPSLTCRLGKGSLQGSDSFSQVAELEITKLKLEAMHSDSKASAFHGLSFPRALQLEEAEKSFLGAQLQSCQE